MSSPVSDSTGDNEQTLPAVGSLWECSLDNVYGCAENFLLEILALVSVVYGVMALRKILKDRNQILDVWDKVIVFIGFGQFVMLAVFYGAFNTQLWQFSIRSLFFANSILICHTVFCIHEIKEETKQTLIKVLKGTFIYLFGLWFFCGFLHKNIPEAPYNCMRIDWMLISGSNLILGCIQAYVTLSIIQSIQNYTNPDVGYPEEGIQNYSKDDGENRKVQLTGLMLGIFLPAFIQFLWDYVAHTHAANLIECNDYFYASSFLTLVLFLVGKFICFFLTPMSIFFVFYWKNRNYINTVQDNPNGQFFYDRRSELIEKYSF